MLFQYKNKMKTLNVLTLVELASSYAVAKDIQYLLTDNLYVSVSELCSIGSEFEKENPEFILDVNNTSEERDWVKNSTDGHIKVTYNENWEDYMVTIKSDYAGDFYIKRSIDSLVNFIKERKKKS